MCSPEKKEKPKKAMYHLFWEMDFPEIQSLYLDTNSDVNSVTRKVLRLNLDACDMNSTEDNS